MRTKSCLMGALVCVWLSAGASENPQETMTPRVAIVMGSDSDLPMMEDAAKVLKLFGIPYEIGVVSAHRTPQEMAAFAQGARAKGIRVIIAGAGGAAHLPGMIAAQTELPVIGVPRALGALQGQDALLSIVQMPKGVPVATVAIGNSWNAGILAAQILGAGEGSEAERILDKVSEYKKNLRDEVLEKNKALQEKFQSEN